MNNENICGCGKQLYLDNDRDVYMCECGNEVKNMDRSVIFSGDPIECNCEA